MAAERRRKGGTETVGQPGDAAEKAFREMRWEHRGIPKPPDSKAVIAVVLLFGAALALAALIADRHRGYSPAAFLDTITEEEARALPDPPDLGAAPELDGLVDWSIGGDRIDYEGHVTMMWFRRQVTCSACSSADGYMRSMHERLAGSGLQVVDVLDIAPERFARLHGEDSFLWLAVPDPDGSVAGAFVPDAEVPAHYVVIVDAAGRIRYADATFPRYFVIEQIMAKLLLDV